MQKNFVRALNSYNAAAIVQKSDAEHLFALINQYTTPDSFSPFLEIGAGTGFLTKLIFKQSNIKGIVSDISPEITKYLSDSLTLPDSISVKTLDGELFNLNALFNTVISSSAFQWFNNLSQAIQNIKRHLYSNGKLIFSMYIDKTFFELRKTTSDLNISFPGHEYFNKSEILYELDNQQFTIDFHQDRVNKISFPNTLSFFQHLKSIGSTNASTTRLTPKNIKTICNYYDKCFSHNNQISVTYHTLYVVASN